MKNTKKFYRRVIKISGARYVAVGSFVPVSWEDVTLAIALQNEKKIVIVLENANGRK